MMGTEGHVHTAASVWEAEPYETLGVFVETGQCGCGQFLLRAALAPGMGRWLAETAIPWGPTGTPVRWPVQQIGQRRRFESALAFLTATGLHAELDTRACCRSCACAAVEAPRHALAHEFAARWQSDRLVYGPESQYDGTTVQRLYFNFTDLPAAQACRSAFTGHGFVVEWDGDPFECVKVSLL